MVPRATIKNVTKEQADGKDVYEVESMDGTQARDLLYYPDGALVSLEETIDEATLPAAVVNAITARYPTATLGRCERLIEKGVTSFEILLKGAPVAEVELTPQGKFISPKQRRARSSSSS